jgi:hypothetical protein
MPSYERIMALRNNPEAVLTPEPAPPPGSVDPADPNRLAVMLDQVSAQALAKLAEILALPINTSDGNLMRALSSAINSALSTQAKVDELRLRQRHTTDLMPRIIEMMQEEKEKLRELEDNNLKD